MSEPVSITNSMVNTARDCWYKYYLEYIRKLTPVAEAEYFVWGEMVHRVAEGMKHGKELDESVIEMRGEFELATPRHSVEEYERYERFCLLLPYTFNGHYLKYHSEDEYYEPVFAEEKFEIPIRNGYVLKGKIDGVFRDVRDGKLLVHEVKTAAQTGVSYWNRLPLDLQIRIYLFAVQKGYGFQTNKVLYDVFKKPMAQQVVRESETAEEWAQRIGVVYLRDNKKQYERQIIEVRQELIDQIPHDLDVFIQELEFHESNTFYPQHHPGNRKGGCDFFKICVFGEDSWAEGEFFTRHNKHPELEGRK